MIKTKHRSKEGFKIFKQRLRKLHENRIKCINNFSEVEGLEKFMFKCNDCGHEFPKAPTVILNIRKGRKHPPGCKMCGGSNPKTYADVKKITEMLGIKVTSKKFFDNPKKWNAHTKLPLECPKGHKIPNKNYNKLSGLVKEGKKIVCNNPSCNPIYSKYEIEEVHILAKKKGVIFKDKIFKGIYKEHKWECIKNGHLFLSTLNSIRKNNTPCTICYEELFYNSIPKLADWLKENEPTIKIVKGEIYRGNQKKIQIKCSQCSTISRKRPSQILNRSLCYVCSKNKKELIVFQSMNQLFGGQWDYNTKPLDWLVNENGKKMELDGFCKELNLAFEHHGGQHYRCIPKMTPTSKDLKSSKARDKRKERLCYEHGIKLIVIQELYSKTVNLKQEIKDQCNGKKILYGGFYYKNCFKKFRLPKDFDKKCVKIYNIYNELYSLRFSKSKEVATQHHQIIKKSKKGNIFIERKCNLCKDTSDINLYRYLKHPRCGICNGTGVNWKSKREIVNFYQTLANNNNAKFLTNKWKGWNEKLKFKCNKCSKDPSLIHPHHSEFEIKPQSLNDRFEQPLKEMKLKKNLAFHTKCGKFRLGELSLNDVRKYIKRFEPTAEILITKDKFIPKKGKKYKFRCSNKRHSTDPEEWFRNIERITDMNRNNSFGCRKCGQYNRKKL